MNRLDFTGIIANKTVRNIFVVYVLLLIFYVAFYFYRGYVYFEPSSAGLAAELYRSLGGNLLFFGLLGLGTLIPTLRDPREEPIERRLGFLITSRKLSQTALHYIRNEIILLCGYYERAEASIIIREYNADSHSMKVERRSIYTMRNTFSQEVYVDNSYKFSFTPDKILDQKGPYGEIIQVDIHEREKSIFSLKSSIILNTPEIYTVNTPLRIEKDGLIKITTIFWLLCTTIAPYFISYRRYCDFCVISVTNSTQVSLEISNDCNGGGDFTLAPNQSKVMHQGPLEPGRKNIFRIRQDCAHLDVLNEIG